MAQFLGFHLVQGQGFGVQLDPVIFTRRIDGHKALAHIIGDQQRIAQPRCAKSTTATRFKKQAVAFEQLQTRDLLKCLNLFLASAHHRN